MKYNKAIFIKDKILSFKKYFLDTWLLYFVNGSLNYINLNKNFRSHSYIENYNKRIKDCLSMYIYYINFHIGSF